MSDTKDPSPAWALITPVVMLVLVPFVLYFAWAYGYCAAHIWRWHIEPVAGFGIDWRVGAGVWLIKCVLFPTRLKTDDDESAARNLAHALAFATAPWVMLLVGWVLS